MGKIDRITEWGWMAGLLVLPWVWWPWADIAYEVPRVIVFRWWVWGLAFLSIWKKLKPLNVRVVVWLLLWVGAVFFASTSSFVPSLSGNYYREDGLLTMMCLVLMAFAIARMEIPLKKLSDALLVASGIVSVFVVWLWVFTRIVKWLPPTFWWTDGAVAGTFGNPHMLAGFLLMGLAHVVGRRCSWVMVVIHFLALVATQAWLIVGLGLVIICWRWLFVVRTRWLAVVLTLLYMCGFIWWVFRPVHEFESEARQRIWRRGAMAFWERPWLGWGWAQFGTAIEYHYWPFPYRLGSDVYIDKAHSSVVELGVTTGLIGLSAYVVLWVVVGQRLWAIRHQHPTWLFVMMAYLLVSQLNVMSIMTDIVGWMVVGVAMREGSTSSVVSVGGRWG